MTEFEKIYQNYNPRQAALDEARALLTAAAKAAMADGALPEAELPAFIVEIPADTKNGDIASNIAMAGARSWRKAPRMIADALLGEITPAMAAAVCQSGAKRVLIPVNHCDNYIVGVPEQPIGDLVTAAVQKVTDLCGGSSC